MKLIIKKGEEAKFAKRKIENNLVYLIRINPGKTS
jgi:hypothetical protein